MSKTDYFKIIYKILKYLKRVCEEGGEIDEDFISAQRFGIDYKYWQSIIADIADEGYIAGIVVKRTWENDIVILNIDDIRITMNGREYLEENHMMRKTHDLLKGIKDMGIDRKKAIDRHKAEESTWKWVPPGEWQRR